MDLRLTGGRYAIVGGTAGIGFATARILAESGARVAIIGRDRERTAKKAEALTHAGGQVRGFAGDAAIAGQAQPLLDAAVEWLGGLDGLAITAGPMHRTGPFLDYTDTDWEDYFQSTLMASVRSARAAIPHLQSNRGGTLVLTSAYSTRSVSPRLAPYVAMKSAIASLTISLAMEFGADRIRVNCVAPGAVATEALDEARSQALATYGPPAEAALNRHMKEVWKMDVALGRVGSPHELAELYAFLLSPRAGYLTGAIINHDGGTKYF